MGRPAYKDKPANNFGKVFAEWNKAQEKPYSLRKLADLTGMSYELVRYKLAGVNAMTVDEAILLCNVTGAPFTKLINIAKQQDADNYSRRDKKKAAQVVLTA